MGIIRCWLNGQLQLNDPPKMVHRSTENEIEYTFIMDHTAPVFEDRYSHIIEAWIDYYARDAVSGLASYKLYDKYGVERDDDSKYEGWIMYDGFSTGIDGFYLEAIDNAGNVAKLEFVCEGTFGVEAEIIDGGYEYKNDILGYLPGSEITLDIRTHGYVEYVEVIFTRELSNKAREQGYEIDRTIEANTHFIYDLPLENDDSFQYVFKIPELPEITDYEKYKEEEYEIIVKAYRNGICRKTEVELPVCNEAYIKKRMRKYFKTIIIY